jgi:hypothetical protein
VESLEERMDRLKHEIQRSIVSEETFGRYKQLQEDIYSQMVHKNEEFNKLHQVVEETRKRFDAGNLHRKEIRTYDLLDDCPQTGSGSFRTFTSAEAEEYDIADGTGIIILFRRLISIRIWRCGLSLCRCRSRRWSVCFSRF